MITSAALKRGGAIYGLLSLKYGKTSVDVLTNIYDNLKHTLMLLKLICHYVNIFCNYTFVTTKLPFSAFKGYPLF